MPERKPFEREQTANDFDYNSRKWRNTRKAFFAKPENQLCIDCQAEGIATPATVADHEPQAKELIAKGLDPYAEKYLKPRCARHHNKKSGREGAKNAKK